MTDEEFIDACFQRFLLRAPDAEAFAYYLPILRGGANRLDVIRGIVVSDEFLALLLRQAFGPHVGTPVLAFAPPGHYYSPIPSRQDVARHAAAKFAQGPESLAGLDLNVDVQLEMVKTLGPLAADLVFVDNAGDRTRYSSGNEGFVLADAVALGGMMRHFRPHRIIEVGAGWSTAAMLDVAEHHLTDPVTIDCIDPEPQRLRSLLRDGDEGRLTVHELRVQDMPLSFFTTLEENDILFIDSSHVLKLGSDVSFLLLDVLPRLARGVVVHFHDIPTPFEYPPEWYDEGRAWNEAPTLRAFLIFNRGFEILFFCEYLVRFQRAAVEAHLPCALRGKIGAASLWLRRV